MDDAEIRSSRAASRWRRYFMPFSCHPTLPSPAQCIAACWLMPGTVADGLAVPSPGSPALVISEHPSGAMTVAVY